MAVDVPLDADFAHPVNRRVRLRHQDFGQFLADSAARNPLQVGMELLGCVSGQIELRESRVIYIGQELANLVGARKYPAKSGMREPRVAAEFRLRRLFEHDYLGRAGLFCGHRGFKRRATTAYYDHGYSFSSHHSCLPGEKFEIRISQYNKPHIQIRSFDWLQSGDSKFS